MTASQDFVALDWIKGEVVQTLDKAQQALLAVAESPGDSDKMRVCLSSIHQVHSTLRMVELSGPVQIAGEMENLAQALMNQSVSQVDEAQEALMQSILQMPRYLDRIHREQKELPQASLSIVNNLRIARGERKLTPSATGAKEYDLNPFSQSLSTGARDIFEKQKGAENVPKLRQKYQQALLALLKKNKPRENLTLLGKVLAMSGKLCSDAPIGHLMNLSVALIEGVGTGAIKLDNAIGSIFKRLDKPLKQLSEGALDALGNSIAEDLVTEILDRICDSDKVTPRMRAVMDKYLVSAEVDDFAIMGPDDDTIGTVIKILMDELKGVTDKLDLYVRADVKNKQDLVDMVPLMGRISGTLSMVGLQEYQDQVDKQIAALKAMQTSAAEPSEDQLFDMARAFLELESKLGSLAGDSEDGEDADKLGDLDEAQATVAKETRVGLSQCTDAVLELVASNWDRTKIQRVPNLLLSLRGGLIIINQPRGGDVLLACARYIEKVLLEDEQVPGEEQIDYLADAITSIDYFLERLLENSSEPYIHMIEVAEESVEKLGFEVSEVLEKEADREVQAKVSTYEVQLPDAAGQELEGDASGLMALSDEEGSDTGVGVLKESGTEAELFDVASLEQEEEILDDEIIEIFIEESGEVLETIAKYFPKWKINPADMESLTEVRRAFHTLKGSGRMVGATVVGELSWSIENMLNRVINKSIENGIAIVTLVEEAVGRIPEGVAAFQNQDQEAVNYEDLIARAEAYSSGVASADDDLADVSATPLVEEELSEDEIALAEELAEEASTEEKFSDVETLVLEDESLEAPQQKVPLQEVPLQEEIPQEELLEEEPLIDIESEAAADDDEVMKALEALASEEETHDETEDISLEELIEEDPQEQQQNFLSQDVLPEDHSSLLDDSLDLIDLEADEADIDESLNQLEAEVDGLSPNLDAPNLEVESETEAAAEPEIFLLDEIETSDSTGGVGDELAEIFTAEANEHLQVLNNFVQHRPGRVTPELIASFHTLRGSAGMAGIDSVASITGPLERLGIQYHSSGTAVDPDFYGLVQSGVEFIEQIVSDLTRYQDAVPGIEQFVAQVEALCDPEDESEPEAGFEFEEIRILPEANSILDQWDKNFIRDLVEELHYVNREAVKTDKDELVSLSGSILNVYQNLTAKPDRELMEKLKQAHDSLIDMLDHLAASQDLILPLDIVNSLDSIEFEQQDELDFKALTKEAWGLLIDLGAAIQSLKTDVTNLMRVEEAGRLFDELADKFYTLGLGELSAITTPLRELCSQLVAGTEELTANDIRLMEICRGEISDQLNRVGGIKDNAIVLDEAVISMISERMEGGGNKQADVNDQIELVSNDDLQLENIEPEDLNVGSLEIDGFEEENPDLGSFDLDASAGLEETPSIPSEPVMDEIDEEILAMFLEEAEEIVEEFDQNIHQWSSNPASSESLDALLRHLHTLKGGARMAGLNTLGEHFHDFETELIGIQQNPVAFDEAFFGSLNQRLDEINRRLEVFRKIGRGEATTEEIASLNQGLSSAVQGGEVPRTLEDLSHQEQQVAEKSIAEETAFDDGSVLEEDFDFFSEQQDVDSFDDGSNSIADGFDITAEGSEFSAEDFDITAEGSDITADGSDITSEEMLSETGVPDPETGPAGQRPVNETTESSGSTSAGSSQDIIRVNQEIVENLISLAGESSITRGRVEQQISDFGDSLEEMEATIGRMRNQVRKLEIEAESRETLVRSSLPNAGGGAFDDLEMDRYTFLQEISRGLSESASDMMDLKDTLANKSRDAETLLHQQARIGGELQESLTRTRMVPFARLIPRLRRIIRQVSAEVGKSVRFETFNVEGELDRTVLDRIVAPLEHMLRNAVDHGIEDTETRKAANKPETGRISLRLSREGGYIVVHTSDDGAGIDVAAVEKKAREKGLIPKSAKLSDQEIIQFIRHAGFSTAEKLTQISGRGVGMDVVDTEIKQLGGTLTINSKQGVGSEFVVRLPFTVSINRALMVVVKEETYAVPLNTIEGIVRVSPYELETYYHPDAPMFEYAGQPYRLFYLGKLLEKSDNPNLAGVMSALPVILARSGDQAVALQVDRVIGSREIVSKALGSQFNDLSGVSGATVLGDGSVVIILDIMSFVRMADLKPRAEKPQQTELGTKRPGAHIRTVMVVDDSVTVRKVTSRLIERQGWEVVTAKDGVDALNQLQDIYPDVMLLDIEMPKMDGYEVLSTIRRDERLKELPIIMITSRTGEKHKQQAFELGVDQYLGKPFQEASLLSTIEEVLSSSKVKR